MIPSEFKRFLSVSGDRWESLLEDTAASPARAARGWGSFPRWQLLAFHMIPAGQEPLTVASGLDWESLWGDAAQQGQGQVSLCCWDKWDLGDFRWCRREVPQQPQCVVPMPPSPDPAPQLLIHPQPSSIPSPWGSQLRRGLQPWLLRAVPASGRLSRPGWACSIPILPHGFAFLLLPSQLLSPSAPAPLSLPPLCLRDTHNSPVKYIQCKYIKSRRLPAAYVFMK